MPMDTHNGQRPARSLLDTEQHRQNVYNSQPDVETQTGRQVDKITDMDTQVGTQVGMDGSWTHMDSCGHSDKQILIDTDVWIHLDHKQTSLNRHG